MDSGYYAAMTGLVARTQALDTAAANLANAGTPGYRAEREFFRSVLLGPDAVDSQLGETVNNYGLLGGDRLSMAQGALEQTGNPLDLAIEGRGFFMAQTPNGMLVVQATRQLTFSQQTQLITLRGLVRPEDVSNQNQVLSTAMTDLELDVTGKGIVSDSTYRQNPLVRFLERLLVF
jgi:flagellar basal-body rod protein FlgF